MITRVLAVVAMAIAQTQGVFRFGGVPLTGPPGPDWEYPRNYLEDFNPVDAAAIGGAAVTSVASVSATGAGAPSYSVVGAAAGPFLGGGFDGPRRGGWKYTSFIVASPITSSSSAYSSSTSSSGGTSSAAAGGSATGAHVYDGGYAGPWGGYGSRAPPGGPGYLAVGAGTGGSVISGVAGAVSAASAVGVGVASYFPAAGHY